MTVDREINFIAATLTFGLFLFLGPTSVKSQGDKAVLHVTSVRKEEAKDWCDTGNCAATRFTVEGYRAAKNPNQVIRYVLECIEVVNLETNRISLDCARVQAGEDYDVKVWPDAIVLQPPPAPTEGTAHGVYSIKSQREEEKDK
jgi:hypothetical protein